MYIRVSGHSDSRFESERTLIDLRLGDCLEIMKTIPDKSIDLVLTDPPYGINIASKGTVGVEVLAKLKDYGSSDWDKSSPPQEYFNEMLRVSKIAVIFGGNYFTDKLPPNKCWICWDKQIPKGFTKAQMELAWTNSTTYSRLYSSLWHGMIRNRNFGDEERYHPTQKSIQIIKYILNDFSGKNQTILDPFMGSGTTGVACKELGRNFIGIEISPEYFKIAERRINNTQENLL